MMRQERKANRLHGFDYSRDALYFVTSCVKDRICCFGEVVDGQMIVNSFGTIAQRQWTWLAEQYPYVVLHAYVIMPNHMHGIIEIDSRRVTGMGMGAGTAVGTGRDLSLRPSSQPTVKIKSLSELIGAYKTTVSKQIRLTGYSDFAWQRSFYDHIIRDEKAFHTISEYIRNNPHRWEEDRFYL